MITEYFTLQQAVKHKTQGGLIPFLVAHECRETYKDACGTVREKTRTYYAFESVDHFLSKLENFPHSHEVIWDRLSTNRQQGRLIFDFDFETPWAGIGQNFVPVGFEKKIEDLIVKTFDKFYVGVDTQRFVFVWLVSDTEKKWSKHLIVKNAFFVSDWKLQCSVFYSLMLSIAEEEHIFSIPSLEKLIDIQVPRTNGTMRICGCSKIGGKVLMLESPQDATVYDTFVQIFRYKDLKSEQEIKDINLKKGMLTDMFHKDPEKVMKSRFLKDACIKCYVDLSMYYDGSCLELTAHQIQDAFQTFNTYYKHHLEVKKQDVFSLGKTVQSVILLNRLRPAPCMLSGTVHDSENAFLIVNESGVIHFYCRRDCRDSSGNKGMMILCLIE